MRTRRMVCLAMLVVIVESTWPRAPLADEAEPVRPTLQKTTVHGDLPDLTGRWLALGIVKLPSGTHRNLPALWEVGGAGKDLTVTVRLAELPEPQEKAVEAASEAEKEWEPSRADLDAIAAAWDTLPPQAVRTESVETDLSSHDAFDDAAKAEPTTRDALWFVKQTFNLDVVAAAPVIRQAALYSALTRSGGDWEWEGNYTYVILAAAPFPIPITLNGTFRLYRLDHPPVGLLARFLDAFKGCGRR